MSTIELTEGKLDTGDTQGFLNTLQFLSKTKLFTPFDVGLQRQFERRYGEMRPLCKEELRELSDRYSITPDVLHVIAMQQSGISAPAEVVDWHKVAVNAFPSLPDVEIKPEKGTLAPWALKTFYAAPDDKTPYRLEQDSRGGYITFWGEETGIQARLSHLKQRQYSYPGSHYVYTDEPLAVTVNPIGAPCAEACGFCPVTYMKRAVLYQQSNLYSGAHATHVTSPEVVINQIINDKGMPPLNAVDRLALVTAKFPDGLSEEDTYPAYAARLAQAASRQGFQGSLFLLADLSPEDIEVYAQYADPSITSIYAHTLEVFDADTRRHVMPGHKGEKSFDEAQETVSAAKGVFTQAGFFYIAGIEKPETAIAFLNTVASMGDVYPWVHALNAYAPGIMKTMQEKDIKTRLDHLLQVQRALIQRFGPLVSYNLYSLVPHGASLNDQQRLVY